jgi:hypothetical protein
MTYNINKSYKDINADAVRSLINYNSETGCFIWRKREGIAGSWNTQNAGKNCGRFVNGYLYIRIGVREYRAHRLAWLIVTGEWPKQELDHINGRRDDNRFCNLRLANRIQQGHNRKSAGKSGILGVHWCKTSKKWYAFTRINGKKKNLGGFNCPAAASFAYQIATYSKIGKFATGGYFAI